MFLLAAQMSVVPLISAAIPVPDPPPVTDISTSGFVRMNASAQVLTRWTIVSEPLIVNDVLDPEDAYEGLPVSARAMNAQDANISLFDVIIVFPLFER